MKNQNWLLNIVSLASVLIFIGFGPEHVFSDNAVTLTTHNLYPYGSYPEGKKGYGLANEKFRGTAVDVVRCAFDKMSIPLKIQVVPWERAQILAKTGYVDGFFAGSQKNSRDEYAIMSAIIADQKWNWYLLKENPLNPMDSSFKSEGSVGGFLGANMLKWMEKNGYNIHARPKTTEQLLKMLIKKRIDAVMANNYVMAAHMEKYGVSEKIKIYTNKNKPLGVYFTKKFNQERPGIIATFNKYVPGCRK